MTRPRRSAALPCRGGARCPAEPTIRKEQAMSKIKSTKQFKEHVDAAFAMMQTRDEAKAA